MRVELAHSSSGASTLAIKPGPINPPQPPIQLSPQASTHPDPSPAEQNDEDKSNTTPTTRSTEIAPGKPRNNDITPDPKRTTIAVFIDEAGKGERLDLAQAIAKQLQNKAGNQTTVALFTTAFTANQSFDKVFDGDFGLIKSLQVNTQCDYLVLGQKTNSFQTLADAQDMVTANVDLEVQVISTKEPVIVDRFTVSAEGAAFSQEKAESEADDTLLKNLKAHGFSSLGMK